MRRFKPSPAMVVALLALFVALGGTGYAALTITGKNVKNGSLTGADLKDNSVKSIDIANGSLLSRDFKAGQLPAGQPGAQGQQGQQGLQGQKGEKGDQGPIGPSDAYFDFAPTGDHPVVTVPAGDYTAVASGYVYNGTGTPETVSCGLQTAADINHHVEVYETVPGGDDESLAATTVFHLPSGGQVEWACPQGPNVYVVAAELTVTRVGTLHL